MACKQDGTAPGATIGGRMDNTERFIASGGKITVCKPQPDRKLNKEERKQIQKTKIPKPPKNGHDPNICQPCPNKGFCPWPCHPLSYVINGIKPSKEEIINPDHQPPPTTDYKDVLNELREDRETSDLEMLDAIRETFPLRRRLIAAGHLAWMTQKQIASETHISQTRISRIFQGLTKT
jgi:hypothetical protein